MCCSKRGMELHDFTYILIKVCREVWYDVNGGRSLCFTRLFALGLCQFGNKIIKFIVDLHMSYHETHRLCIYLRKLYGHNIY